MILRPHQIDCVAAIEHSLARFPSALAIAATGTGKTTVIAECVRRWVEAGERVLVLAHTREIVAQIVARLESVGLLVGVECGDQRSTGEPVIVASVQSLASPKRLVRVLRPTPPSKVVVDEAHHAVSPSYTALLGSLPPHRLLGLTATPLRSDRRPLGRMFATVAHNYTRDQATRDGYLVPFTERHADSARGLASLTRDMRTVVYARTCADSRRLARDLCSLGLRAAHVDGDTPNRERAQTLARFAAGELQYLCNANLVTEGWDVPQIDAVAVMRGVRSSGPLAQMLGRGLRIAPGKRECLLVHLPEAIPLDDPAPCGRAALDGVNRTRSPIQRKQTIPRAQHHTNAESRPSLGRRVLSWLGW